MSFATRLTALLIALIFLGATAQCASVCVTKNVPPCHQKHVSCNKLELTADRTVTADASVPTLQPLPVTFTPVLRVCRRAPLSKQFFSPPNVAQTIAVLLI